MRSKNWPSMPKNTHTKFNNCKNSPSKKIVGIHKKGFHYIEMGVRGC